MKYLQLASVSTPAAVSTWFQDELVNRGVDAAYTFYVLSLLREPQDPDEVDNHRAGSAYRYPPQTNEKPELQRLRAKRCAVECLKSAALEDSSFESFDALVEELLARLEPDQDSSEIPCMSLDNSRDSGRATATPTKAPITTTTTKKTTTTTRTTTTTTTTTNAAARTAKLGSSRTRPTAQLDRQNFDKDRDNSPPKDERTLAERAKKYFEAFPALQAQGFKSNQSKKLHSAPAATDSGEGVRGQTISERQKPKRSVSSKIKNRKLRKKDAKVCSSPVGDGHRLDQRITVKDNTDRAVEDRLGAPPAPADRKLGVPDRPLGQPPAQGNKNKNNNNPNPFHRHEITLPIPVTSAPHSSGLVATTVVATPTCTTPTRFTGGEMMSSIVQEESLVSNLTKKFDSRLAAIWADAVPVEEQTSGWRISLDLTAAGNKITAGNDKLIFTIPHMFHFTTIVDDKDDVEIASRAPLHAFNSYSTSGELGNGQTFDNELTSNGHGDSGAAQNYVLHAAEDEAMGFREAGGRPSPPPPLCLNNSTLNYDKEKTAFTEVIPSRRTSLHSTSLLRTFSEVQNVVQAVGFIQEAGQEDLLFSQRTHFTPIRVDIEDMVDADAEGGGDRPLSSSLEELSSYHLPPDPPKRLNHKNQQPAVAHGKSTVPDLPSKAPASSSELSQEKHDDVKPLWKMVEFEVPQPPVDGDVLGVAQYWQGTATNSGVSEELRQEILEEEDELFKDLFQEALRAASHTSSLTEEANTTSTGYDSYQDTSLEYGAVGGGGGAEGRSISAEEPCNIEYLSHFSNGSHLSSVFDTPEVYDSAIVISVQDMQRQLNCQRKKPCTFYMEGNCRRTDCKFSHDLSNITCRFWEDNCCFKGLACPFLHGYAAPIEDDVSVAGSQNSSGGDNKEAKRANKFTIDSEQDFPSLYCNLKNDSYVKISKKGYKKPSNLPAKKVTAGRKKKKKTLSDSGKTTPSDSARLASSSASVKHNSKINTREKASNVLKKVV